MNQTEKAPELKIHYEPGEKLPVELMHEEPHLSDRFLPVENSKAGSIDSR